MSDLEIPYEFEAGADAEAAQVNENFDSIRSFINDGSLGETNIGEAQIKRRHLANGAVVLEKMSSNSVGSSQLRNGSVRNQHLENGAVGSAEFAPKMGYTVNDRNETRVDGQEGFINTGGLDFTVNVNSVIWAFATVRIDIESIGTTNLGRARAYIRIDSDNKLPPGVLGMRPAVQTDSAHLEATIGVQIARPISPGSHTVALYLFGASGALTIVQEGWATLGYMVFKDDNADLANASPA